MLAARALSERRITTVVDHLLLMRSNPFNARDSWIAACEAFLELDEADRNMVWVVCLDRLLTHPPPIPRGSQQQVGAPEWMWTCRKQMQWLHERIQAAAAKREDDDERVQVVVNSGGQGGAQQFRRASNEKEEEEEDSHEEYYGSDEEEEEEDASLISVGHDTGQTAASIPPPEAVPPPLDAPQPLLVDGKRWILLEVDGRMDPAAQRAEMLPMLRYFARRFWMTSTKHSRNRTLAPLATGKIPLTDDKNSWIYRLDRRDLDHPQALVSPDIVLNLLLADGPFASAPRANKAIIANHKAHIQSTHKMQASTFVILCEHYFGVVKNEYLSSKKTQFFRDDGKQLARQHSQRPYLAWVFYNPITCLPSNQTPEKDDAGDSIIFSRPGNMSRENFPEEIGGWEACLVVNPNMQQRIEAFATEPKFTRLDADVRQAD